MGVITWSTPGTTVSSSMWRSMMPGWRRNYDCCQCAVLPEFRPDPVPAAARRPPAGTLARPAVTWCAADRPGALAGRVVAGWLSAWRDRRAVDHRNGLAAGGHRRAPGLGAWRVVPARLAIVVRVRGAGGGALSRVHGRGHAGYL